MTSSVVIREESPEDERAIHDLTRIAFQGKEYSSNTEHLIVDALRADSALELSLVAVDGRRVVGHIAFSRVAIQRGKQWYALGPISVAPDLQRQGIGSALIERGLSMLRDRTAAGCVLVGDPNYYSRFGFRHDRAVILEGMPSEYSMVLRFQSNEDGGSVKFHPAFSSP
jgi:predicted N-acetyltransferase YhbS